MVDTSVWELLGQDPWPEQGPIGLDDIQALIEPQRRRWRLKDFWSALHEPSKTGGDWGVTVPSKQPYWNALKWDRLPIDGPNRISGGGTGGFLLDDSFLPEVKRRIESLGAFIGIRDCLAMSFALDYTHENGPNTPYTDTYRTLTAAEPRKGTPADDQILHARRLVKQLEAFVQRVNSYAAAQIVTAVPPKDSATVFHLPIWLADQLAGCLNMDRGANKVKTVRSRQSMRNTVATDRLKLLEGTIEVDPGAFRDKIVLIVDDVYQSGTSMNYLAYLLQQAGARAMFGLSCVKTLKNTDAVG